MNRRGFLKFLPAAIVGGRKAIAEAAKDEAAKWALIKPTGVTDERAWIPVRRSYETLFPTAEKMRSNALSQLATLFSPSNVDRIRRGVVVTRLDPDIASLRSFSLSVKMSMQRERAVQKELYWEKDRLDGIIATAIEAVKGEQ